MLAAKKLNYGGLRSSGSSILEGLEVGSGSSKPNNNLNNGGYYINSLRSYLLGITETIHTYKDRFGTSDLSVGSSGTEAKKFQTGSEAVDNLKTDIDNIKTITVSEAHNIIGKSTKTIYKWCDTGKLLAWKVPGPAGDYWKISYDSVIEVKNSLEKKFRAPIPEEVPEVQEVPNLEGSEVESIEVSEYIPSVVENFVTRDELNNYTLVIKDFTEALNHIRAENQELKTENAQLHKKVEHLISHVSRVDEFIESWRQKKKLPWWRKLFSK